MRDAIMRLLPILICATVGACTESPDVVAIALGDTGDDGGLSGEPVQAGGSGGQPALGDTGLFTSSGSGSGECDYEQALMDARIPVETIFVALSCKVPLGAVQPTGGEAAPQQLVAQLLNTSSRLDAPSMDDAQQCDQQPGGWWVEGQTVHLCPELCQFVSDVVSDLVQTSCDAAADGAASR